jgi:hypothetical protein
MLTSTGAVYPQGLLVAHIQALARRVGVERHYWDIAAPAAIIVSLFKNNMQATYGNGRYTLRIS